jgi:hypothetical protein
MEVTGSDFGYGLPSHEQVNGRAASATVGAAYLSQTCCTFFTVLRVSADHHLHPHQEGSKPKTFFVVSLSESTEPS